MIPIDRPGLGWLLAGTVVAGTLYAVDHHARTRPAEPKATADDKPATPAPTAAGRFTDGPAPAAGGRPSTRTAAMAASDGADAAGHRSDTALPDPAQVDDAAAPALPADASIVGAGGTAPSTDATRGETAQGATDTLAAATASGDPNAGAHGLSAAPGAAPAEREPAPSPTANVKEMRSRTSGDPNAQVVAPEPSPAANTASRSGDADDSGASARTRLPRSARVWWAAAALVLLGVGAVRAAGWLFVLCVVAACVAGSLAVLGRRTRWGVVHDMVAVPLATLDAVPWAWSGVREARPKGASSVRKYGVSVAATVALLVVFVPLLGGADATFADLLSGLVPAVDGASAWHWILLFGVVGIGALAALYLLAGPPAAAEEGSRPARQWSRSEWVLPVSALTVLFGVFVGAQFVALFGGDDYVQRTAGLTYAEYARSGFWQLSAVSILTLGVILAVLHWSEQASAADRRWLRVLLTAVSVLSLVIVGSALARMWTYQQAYGFTVLRVLVGVCELWVGLVYLLVLVAVALLRWTWVSRAAVGTALGTLIALAVLNPEHLVAERNIDRWEQGKRLDTGYLSTLSPDIVPALTRLPESLRTQIEDPILADLDEDPWWSWNWARESAR
ncbi:DUF4153 domain-containing protein [Nocardia neocaledoniensis]|uniref:DUF4153 domain-containing protein n=1 Tax=Nocardia neocaledoniensis TaxID=236511 RepID=UPI00245585AD|nr:DUF4153 domain-containing protein [Nocardia neocaledoniensis]